MNEKIARISEKTGKVAGVAMNRRHIPLVQEVIKKLKEVTEITQVDGRFVKFGDIFFIFCEIFSIYSFRYS